MLAIRGPYRGVGVRFTNSLTIFLVFTNSRMTEGMAVFTIHFMNLISFIPESKNFVLFTNSRTKKIQFPPPQTPQGGSSRVKSVYKV